MLKIRNIPIKILVLITGITSTLAGVFGMQVHYEKQKSTKAFSDIKDYMDQLSASDIVDAQRKSAKERDMLLQKAAHTPTQQVKVQTATTTVTPKKIVTPDPVVTPTPSTPKPKSTKKTKSS